MGSRIIGLQRQARELGRLRAGYTVYPDRGRPYPRSSKTWIVTSQSRTYVEAAAELWGGQVEQWQPLGKGAQEWRVITEQPVIDAVLPPGDPISQAYEMWGGGGCQRRCDGDVENISGHPCVCRAQFGEDFHLLPVLGPDGKPQRCQINTRLTVFLPGLPDIGVWRVETHGYWPSVHITGHVETIKALVGPQPMVPVTLAIEPRTKVRDGETRRFVEIVVSLKQQIAFGEIVANPRVLAIGGPADDRTIEPGEDRPALDAAPAQPAAQERPALAAAPARSEPSQQAELVDWPGRIRAASTLDELHEVGQQIANDQRASKSNALRNLWKARAGELQQEAEAAAAAAAAAEAAAAEAAAEQADEDPWADYDPEGAGATEVDDQGEPADAEAVEVDEDWRAVWYQAIDTCATHDDFTEVWDEMEADEQAKNDKPLRAYWWKRRNEVKPPKPGKEQPAQVAAEAEPEPDRQEMWAAVLNLAGGLGWDTPTVSKAFREHTGVDVTQANGWQMRDFSDYIKRELVPA